MTVNAAYRSINPLDEVAKTNDVRFIVHSRLAVPRLDALNRHLNDHLRLTRPLIKAGTMPISGPFFTVQGGTVRSTRSNRMAGLFVVIRTPRRPNLSPRDDRLAESMT